MTISGRRFADVVLVVKSEFCLRIDVPAWSNVSNTMTMTADIYRLYLFVTTLNCFCAAMNIRRNSRPNLVDKRSTDKR